jgi:hypothetical protein
MLDGVNRLRLAHPVDTGAQACQEQAVRERDTREVSVPCVSVVRSMRNSHPEMVEFAVSRAELYAVLHRGLLAANLKKRSSSSAVNTLGWAHFISGSRS